MQTRYRAIFSKNEPMRYCGHLDLQRSLERTIRRANLPLAYSQGFNPRPRIVLASALPLGLTSEGEIVDIVFDSINGIENIMQSLTRAQPPGISFQHLFEVPLLSTKTPRLVESTVYMAIFQQNIPDLAEIVHSLITRSSIERVRKAKTYDLRPLINGIQLLEESTDKHQRISMHLAARDGATGRPDEVVSALGIDPEFILINRIKINLRKVSPP